MVEWSKALSYDHCNLSLIEGRGFDPQIDHELYERKLAVSYGGKGSSTGWTRNDG